MAEPPVERLKRRVSREVEHLGWSMPTFPLAHLNLKAS
ncbi:MAG: hypothetical protein ACI80I_001571 [Akkermansiaceae bacterium]|jgi:hypothetical protein